MAPRLQTMAVVMATSGVLEAFGLADVGVDGISGKGESMWLKGRGV